MPHSAMPIDEDAANTVVHQNCARSAPILPDAVDMSPLFLQHRRGLRVNRRGRYRRLLTARRSSSSHAQHTVAHAENVGTFIKCRPQTHTMPRHNRFTISPPPSRDTSRHGCLKTHAAVDVAAVARAADVTRFSIDVIMLLLIFARPPATPLRRSAAAHRCAPPADAGEYSRPRCRALFCRAKYAAVGNFARRWPPQTQHLSS